MKNNSLAVTTIWFQDPGEVILKAVSVHLLNRERVVIFKGKTNLDSGKLSFPPVKPGKYRMEATAEGFEPLRCGLEITGKEEEELFFLGRKKIPFIFFGGKKVFLEKKPRELGVVFAEKKPTQKTLNRLLPSNKITSTEEFGYQEGFSKKVKLKSKTLRKEVCKYLRKSKKVAFSGLILDTPSGEAIPTGEVFLQLFPGVDREQFLKKVKKESKEFKWVKTISHGEEFIALQYTGEEENFLEKANLFGDREEVYLVDYGLYFGETMTGQVFPADPLRQGQYHLVVTGMPQAWQILQDNGLNFGGNPDLILAVPDGGIQTTGSGAGVPHPDFNTNIVGGNLTAQLTTPNPGRKLYSTVDYRTNAGAGLAIINNNDNVVGSHGTQCAGIASAFSDGAAGVIGVAPNVRLVGAIDPGFTATNNTRISEVYTHLTGFDPVWTPAQYAGGQRFPRNYKNPGLLSNFNSNASLVIPDGSPPDIASYSISNNTYSAAAIRNVFFQAARLGRKRRGTVQVGLAQNACQPFRNNGTWGPDSGFIVVSASGVDHIGRETKAGYSNYAIDLTPGIDVCAPSGTAMGGAVAPPLTVGVLTSTINTSGNTNDTVTTTRTLLANANPGAMSINASTAAVPASSSMALLQRANNPHVFEWVIVVPPAGGVTGNNYPLLHPVRNSYRAADGDRLVLFSGANLHWDLFMDGTSAATPQVAGLAALLLSVRPGMNWLDVRRVLRGTAVPIDIRHRGPLPQNITTANNYLDSGGNVIHATDFNWFEFNPASPRNMAAANPLLDVNGQLDPNGNPAIMSNGAPNYPANNNSFQQYFINMGPPPGGNFRFRKRQAILIGAESTLAAQVPDPGTGNTNFVMVANGNGFDAGNIIIGRDTQTILQITPLNPAGVPTPNIDVLSTDGFRVGDSIQIQLTGGTVIRTVTGFGGNGIFNNGITGSSTRITLNANITMAAGDNAVPVQLDPAAWERATILNRVGNRINLTAGLTNPFNPAGGTIVVRTANCEIRVVKDVQPDGIDERLEVDKFEHTHASAVRVTGGRIADYSFMYGYGRIDGPAAVTAALNYFAAPQVPAAAGTPPVPQEDQYPDIQIRNTLADTGTVATPLVHSPDIWLRKANDMLGNMPAIGAKGPHEQVLPEFRFEKYEGTAANNDLVLSGDYPGAAAATYVITNDGAGNFSCAKDGVHSIGPSAISANTFQPVMDGFSLMFGSSAYDGSEKWTIKAEPASRNFFVRVKNRGLLGTYVPNTMPAVFTATPDFYRVRFFIHLTNGSPVIRYQSAAGLDDLEVKGTYNQAAAGTFTIIIDGTPGGASPDTFSYQHNNGGTTSGEAITGDWQNIGNDVEIKFRSTRGHTLTNRWQLLARPNTANDRFHSLEDFIIGNPTQNPFNFQLDRAGTHLLTTVNFSQSIDNGAAGFNPSLAYNQTRIFHSTWAENLLPVRKSAFSPKPGSPLRMFLLAECVPHDGPLIGNTPANNNNLSYREVLFAHFQFKDATGAGEFRSFIEVDSIGTVSNETMTIDVVSDSVTFTTERVELAVEIEFENNTTESKVFKFTGGTWQFSGGNPAWATGSAPVTGTSAAAATGDQYHVRISIDLKLTHLHARVKVRPNIYSAIQPAIVLAGAYLQVPIYQKSLLPSQRFTGGGKADLAPKSHFFTDHGNIVQTAAEAYGPVSVDKTNRFRTTALFKRQGGTEPKAYAVVNGFVVIQRDPGNNTVVNLVLKPFQQPMAGFTPVKYFIYRGITLTDFLKGINNTDEKLIRDAAGSSAFISRLWPMHTAQNGAEPFESKALGYDPDNQDPNGADLLDDLFFRQDSNIQFPIATKGEHIGNFFTSGGTGTFGFEIVLEEGEFQPDLAYVRKVSHEISVAGMPAGTDAEKFAVRLKREEILNFMDPAAFYGLHRSDKGIITVDDGAGAKTNLPSEQMYENVIDKFNTKNTLYIDIRNENGQSYNFYGKYDDGNGNAFGIGHSIAVITDQAYASDSWPLIIIPATIPNIFYQIFIRLRKDYNKKPILYIEHGRPTTLTTKGRFIAGNHLGTDPNLTNSIGFRMPNHDPGDGNRIGTAWLLKLHYGLQIDAGNTPFPIEVPPTENYKDNLFGPLSLKLNWTGAFKFSWYSAQDKKFIDAGNLGFSHIVNRGLAIEDETQDDRVLFYAAGKDIFNNTNTAFVPYKGMTGGVSKRNSFFEEALLFEGYRLEYDLFEDNGAEIKSLALAPAAINPRPTEGMLMLGLTKDEYTTLKGLPGLNAVYPRNVQLEELAGSPFTVNGKTYRKYKAGVRGLNNDGNHHTAFPVEDIHVYSVDRFFFFSKDFSDAQALPTSYTRNYEESFGAVKRISPKYRIKYIWVAAKTIGIQGKDLRYEIVPGDKVVIKNAADIDNNGTYSVTAVNWTGSDSEIVVDEGISSNTGKLGDLHEVEKPYEDFFIAKDIRPDLNGIQPMPTIVQQFISAVDAAADNAAGLTALTNAVNTFGLEIWNRAREICFNNTFEYADDRILYWARIKMLAALKGHAQVLKSIKERERLTGLLEEKSRGLDSIDIPQAGIKVLVSGSDPFYLGKSILNHNPAGAAALAMDGRSFTRTVNGNPVTFHIESVMLPFRYRDFDRNGGQGIVEEVFEKYINPAANGFKAVDMILALGRNNKRSFFVDRFAARFRGGIIDNENRPSPPGNPSFKLSPALAGDEFYETTLPVNKLVPPSNPGPNGFDVIYNNAFRYNWTDAADTVQTASFLRSANATGQSKVEDAGHPNNALLNGMVPASLTDATTPKKTDIQSASGSAGNYLGNEMFYRVSRLRAAHNIGLPAGSLHVPKIQSDGGYFVPGDNKSLIDALIEEIAKAAAP